MPRKRGIELKARREERSAAALALCASFLLAAVARHQLNLTAPPSGRGLTVLTEAQVDRLTVWWHAPFFSGGGYSSEATDFALALHQQGLPLVLSQHGDAYSWDHVEGLPRSVATTLRELSERRPKDPEATLQICHSEPGAWMPPLFNTDPCPVDGAAYAVGRTMFETDRIPAGWVARCNAMDEIWVPTEFHKQTFVHSGVSADRVVVVPEPLDTKFWTPKSPVPPQDLPRRTERANTTVSGDRQRCFAFLSVFKWERRKAWDVLLRAFIEEFDKQTDFVCLYIKTQHFHSDGEFHVEVERFAREDLGVNETAWRERVPVIEVLSERIPQTQMPGLYKSVDAVVIPSRGEGWGRPHVEAMAMGLPLIATNWSGPTAYLTPTNGFPLRLDGLETIKEGPWRGHKWARPSVAHLRQLMREVYSNQTRASEIGKQARRDIVRRYGLAQIGRQVKVEIERIQGKLKRRSRMLSQQLVDGESYPMGTEATNEDDEI